MIQQELDARIRPHGRLAEVTTRTDVPDGCSHILTPAALDFLRRLAEEFTDRRNEAVERRKILQEHVNNGVFPDFLPETEDVRNGNWMVSPVPSDLWRRWVEITGPASNRKMVINAMNSGADVYMADGEDSESPIWYTMLMGQANLFDAARRSIRYVGPEGKRYELEANPAVLFYRPRGWHLDEHHLLIDGKPIPASLFDFGLYIFHNANVLLTNGAGPYFYLPKLEHYLEARLWNDVFDWSERALGIPEHCIKATVLIETLPAAFQMHEILFELRNHSAGLNCGRWDYIFSYIKTFHAYPSFVLPDRDSVSMQSHCLSSYVRLLINTCHRRGTHAIGGMAAQIPIKDDPEENARAIDKVRSDKLREVMAGHDGTWVAHPSLVPIAREMFAGHLTGSNQLEFIPKAHWIVASDLLRVPTGKMTEGGLRGNIRTAIEYIRSWVEGVGCVPLNHLMEDTATAEICRAQVWQWTHHRVTLDNGRRVTPVVVKRMIEEEFPTPASGTALECACSIFYRLATAEGCADFLTIAAASCLTNDFKDETMSMNDAESRQQSPASTRWDGILRNYSKADVERLRGSVQIEYTIARMGAERLWDLLHTEPYVAALGALTGGQAVEMVTAGLKAIYVSGWQVAADANDAGQTYPDQSLYPADSVPNLVRRMNNALHRADQIHHSKGLNHLNWFAPLVADAEAGFGGVLNAFEVMKAMVEAGAAAVHFEDQLSAVKKCGHLGGKVLVPTMEFIQKLLAARLAADILKVPTILIARTDAGAAQCVTSDADPSDHPFITGERTPEGFYKIHGGLDMAIARGLAYAPYADMIWCETSTPDLDEARDFASAIHKQFPGKLLAYNCSPSFNWKKKLNDTTIAGFQSELSRMGYKFQFITLAGFHSLNHAMYQLARDYKSTGMTAYANFQEREFADESSGYAAVKHQQFVGTGYFDDIATLIAGGNLSTLAMEGSTEQAQFGENGSI